MQEILPLILEDREFLFNLTNRLGGCQSDIRGGRHAAAQMQTAPAATGAVLVQPAHCGRTTMSSVEGAGPGPEQGRNGKHHNDEERSLLSERALLILVVSMGIGLLIGLGAGITAGLSTVGTAGAASGVAVGILIGIGSGTVAGLSAAGALHALISRSNG